jgi:hypothetical protein
MQPLLLREKGHPATMGKNETAEIIEILGMEKEGDPKGKDGGTGGTADQEGRRGTKTKEVKVRTEGSDPTEAKTAPTERNPETKTVETTRKDPDQETGKTRGNGTIKKILIKTDPERSQKRRKLRQRRKASVDFFPSFLASKTPLGFKGEMIHAHCGSI